MVIAVVTASVVVLAALALVLGLRVRRVRSVRAEAQVKRRLVERQERLAELRMQRVVADTIQRMFDSVRGGPR